MNINKVISSETTRLNGQFNDTEYWLDVEPLGVTPALREAYNKVIDDPLLLAKELAKRIKGWNWFDKEEGDLLPTFEVISNLPDELVGSLSDTVSQLWAGDKKKQTPSPKQSGAAAS